MRAVVVNGRLQRGCVNFNPVTPSPMTIVYACVYVLGLRAVTMNGHKVLPNTHSDLLLRFARLSAVDSFGKLHRRRCVTIINE